MAASVTTSMLYDLVSCPHRVAMNLFADPAQRDAPNPFIQLLWEKGSHFEKQVIEELEIPFTDLSLKAADEQERLKLEAMQRGDSLIYSGRLRAAGLLGDPDLLRKEGDGYVAGDIKSGSGEEGPEDHSKPKKHYAVQLALYTDILERKGLSAGRRAFVWDINGKEVVYDFKELQGKQNPRTLWHDYQECLAEAISIVEQASKTLAAYSSACKLCHWYTACTSRLAEANDLTLIPELGRAKRNALMAQFSTIRALAESDPADFLVGKKTCFPGIGSATLEKLHARAQLITAGEKEKPYLREPITLPGAELELFFDIEGDPMRDVCYLHGFIERHHRNNETERFVAFFADEPAAEAERQAFAEAWCYLRERQSCVVYYYSKYERTVYRKLREKYPDVCTEEELEALFGLPRSVDLYDVVRKATEWPTRDFSIKTLASYLGFVWRDPHPSGAASIEWFHRWVETGDASIRQRILDYNEDDCRATRVLRTGLMALP
jgi:predicted RecB family nuclease